VITDVYYKSFVNDLLIQKSLVCYTGWPQRPLGRGFHNFRVGMNNFSGGFFVCNISDARKMDKSRREMTQGWDIPPSSLQSSVLK
jgi:hypothetical protein